MDRTIVQNKRSDSTVKSATRSRVINAALKTLTEVGYGATTARSIAKTGGFAPGVIYYHFDSIQDLMLAALDQTSDARLAAYNAALEGVVGLAALLQRLRALYDEDLAAGHISAVQEVVAGASSSPEMGVEVVKRLQPFIDFTESVVRRFLADTPFEHLVPARVIAFAMVALYLGMETLSHLDGDRSRADSLFNAGQQVSPLLEMVLGAGGGLK